MASDVYSILEDDEIRLLVLCAGEWSHPLHGHLEIERLNEYNQPMYDAVSYAWGDKTDTAAIFLDDFAVSIPQGLHKALCRLRSSSSPRRLWADAACINQSNIQERSHQVSLMSQIFRRASRVYVWLGEDDDGMSEEAVRFLEEQASNVDLNYTPTESGTLGQRCEPRDLGPKEVAQWTLLARMLNQPWFRRVWTVQEIGLAKISIVLYGAAVTTFSHLMKVLGWLETHGQLIHSYFRIKLHPRYVFCILFYHNFEPTLMKEWGCLERIQISDAIAVLKYTRDFGASDARDRIYAFMGLASIEEYSGLDIDVDYRKTSGEVFRDFALQYMRQPSGLRILSQIHEHMEDAAKDAAPSWVPMWNLENQTLELASKLHYYHAGGLEDAPPFHVEEKALVIQGLIWDSVSFVSETCFHDRSFNFSGGAPSGSVRLLEMENLWDGVITHLRTGNFAYDDVHIAFSLTLVAGLIGLSAAEDNIRKHFANFASYLLQIIPYSQSTREVPAADDILRILAEATRNGNEKGDWAQFMVDCNRVCANRRFFATKEGYFGLGPAGTRVDDVCCVLPGAKVPFVLRSDGDEYKLIGECYVHGLMRGEALRSSEVSVKKVCTLRII